jgi:hypothetical protein
MLAATLHYVQHNRIGHCSIGQLQQQYNKETIGGTIATAIHARCTVPVACTRAMLICQREHIYSVLLRAWCSWAEIGYPDGCTNGK